MATTAAAPFEQTGRSWSVHERRRIWAMAGVIGALHLLGWGAFLLAALPRHLHARGVGFGAGVAFTAYTLGMRHAFDADHVSAIDNVTRKLMTGPRRPLETGFFFALGHSSMVLALGVAISIGARTVYGAVVDPHSTLSTVGGLVGTTVAGTFLYAIAAMNLVVLVGITKVFRGLRQGAVELADVDRRLEPTGLMGRLFGRLLGSITRTRQMFFVGMVFGLGFDTATEVVLLAGTAAAATSDLPWYAVLALPLLFAAGMTLFDTADGCFMNVAYGWALGRPVRRLYYNAVVTGLSIASAFLVGTVELAGLLTRELHLHGPLWRAAAGFDINEAGLVMVSVFVVVWAVAAGFWRWGGAESRLAPPSRTRCDELVVTTEPQQP